MFDTWDRIEKIYLNVSEETKFFLESNIVSSYVRSSCNEIGLSNDVARQLILYCRLNVAKLSSESELEEYIKIKNLPEKTIKKIVNDCLSMHISISDYKELNNQIEYSIRMKVTEKLSIKTKYLLQSNSSKIHLLTIAIKYNLIDKKKIIILIGDIILGFYKIEDTVPLLQQELGLDPKTAALLGAEVLEFLAPLSDPNWQPPVEDEESIEAVATETPRNIPVKAPATTVDSVPPESNTMYVPVDVTPTTLTSPQPVHTYATDMATVRAEQAPPIPTSVAAATPMYPSYAPTPTVTEPIYQSNQPARVPLGDLPTYATPPTPIPPSTPTIPDRPRWSTEL